MKPVLSVLFLLIAASVGYCQTGASLLIKPWPTEQTVEATAGATFIESGYLRKVDEDFQIDTYESVGRIRLFPGQLVSPRLGFEYVRLDIDSDVLPDQLVDASFGAGAFVGKWQDWVFGLTAAIGYAGEAPFGDANAWYAKSDIGIAREVNETTRIGIVLNYDGNRTFLPDVPLPGFGIYKQLDEKLLASFGFPINSIIWKPNDRFTLDLIYSIPDSIDVTLRYKLVEPLSVYGQFAGRRHAFVLEGLDRRDRLIYFQRRIEAGLRFSATEQFSAVVAGGYAFGQYFEQGWDTRDADELFEPSDEPYLRVGLDLRW